MGKRGRRNSRYGSWSAEDMGRALSALRNGDMGLNASSKAYGVPKATLKRHLLNQNVHANDEVRFKKKLVWVRCWGEGVHSGWL